MTTEEKIAVLAKAILQLAKEASRSWDFDGETQTASGITLDLEDELRDIAKGVQ